ncbi:MAG: hypothetical protein WBP41_15165 [Saprospiraceae bacterium]
MKKHKKELNVDFIVGEWPLTLAEEQELNEYFQKKKSDAQNSTKTKTQKSKKKSKSVLKQ